MPSFDSIKGENNTFNNGVPEEFATPAKQTNLIVKVFGVMFISLLLTAVVSYGFATLLANAIASENIRLFESLSMIMIISSIGIIVMAIVLPTVFSRNKHSILPSYIIYCLLLSVLISVIFIEYDLQILSLTFGVTAGVFGLMALLGFLSKGNISGLNIVISGLFIGAVVLCLVNIFLQSEELAWIVSFSVFAVILFITMYDIAQIKRTLGIGYQNNSNNLVIYCAFMLYTDFVNIFLRLLVYLSAISKKK